MFDINSDSNIIFLFNRLNPMGGETIVLSTPLDDFIKYIFFIFEEIYG